MTDLLLQDFSDIHKCKCGCGGLKFFLADGKEEAVYISPYGTSSGDNPQRFFEITELMHPLIIDELWKMREALL